MAGCVSLLLQFRVHEPFIIFLNSCHFLIACAQWSSAQFLCTHILSSSNHFPIKASVSNYFPIPNNWAYSLFLTHIQLMHHFPRPKVTYQLMSICIGCNCFLQPTLVPSQAQLWVTCQPTINYGANICPLTLHSEQLTTQIGNVFKLITITIPSLFSLSEIFYFIFLTIQFLISAFLSKFTIHSLDPKPLTFLIIFIFFNVF